MINIALDAMGGSNAPKSTVEGALQAVKKFDDIQITLHGDREKILEVEENLPDRVIIEHTSQALGETEQIFDALKEKRPVSIINAVEAVKEGRCDGAVSAGSTGGVFVSALTLLGVIKGINRPAGLMHIPTFSKENPSFVLIDVGTNADVKARNLNEFAVLGSHYAHSVQGKSSPKVALLSNGTEETKGDKIHKAAYQLLIENEEINFIGNVEPHGLLDGSIDVLVADGFSGNVYLKQHEEMSEQYSNEMLKRIQSLDLDEESQRLVSGEIIQLKRQLATTRYGACILSGLLSPVVITHGRSDGEAIATGIQQLREAVKSQYTQKSRDYFENKNK